MITLSVGTRDNLSRPVVWSTPVPIDEVEGKGVKFFIRQQGVGKFVRLKFVVTNDQEQPFLVSELYYLSIFLMQMAENDNVK